MTDQGRKRGCFALQIGAAIAVTAMVPISDFAANATTPVEKLAALRAAASSGKLELLYRAQDGTLSPIDQQAPFEEGFDRDATIVQPP